MLAVALVAGAGLMLAGCVPSEPVVTPVDTGATAPIFASDEDALAAAVEAYAKYLAAIQKRSNSGADDFSEISGYVTEDQLERERAAADASLAAGRSTRGAATFDRVKAQQYWQGGGVDGLVVYLCLDVTDVAVIDATGVDVTPVQRPDRVALEVEFEISASSWQAIRVARSDVWQDTQYCE